METLSAFLILSALFLFGLQAIGRVTARTRNLSRWSLFIYLSFFFWIGLTLHRALIWLPNSGGVSFDGHIHEQLARGIAKQLQLGLLSFSDLPLFSNEGYRALLGVFYYLTDAPIVVTYCLHAFFAFLGLLFLLETAAILMATRIPLWIPAFIMFFPSALIFTPWNMKEGPVLFSICYLLRVVVNYETGCSRRVSFLSTCLAVLPMIFLRPQIAIAWLGAAAIGITFGNRNVSRAPAILAALAGVYILGFFVIDKVAPGLLDQIRRDGLTSTLDRMTDHAESYGGSSISRLTSPIPVVSGLLFAMFEPNPTYWRNPMFAIVGVECWFLSLAGLYNWFKTSLRIKQLFCPIGITCVLALLGLAFYLGYMYNMGLMVRQRLQLFPAMFLIAILPLRQSHQVLSTHQPRRNS